MTPDETVEERLSGLEGAVLWLAIAVVIQSLTMILAGLWAVTL